MEIEYLLKCEECTDQIEGNASCISEEEDAKTVQFIRDGLKHSMWFWCDVTVEARLVVDGELFRGVDHLGQCSFQNEEDFKAGGYYSDMLGEARNALIDDIKAAYSRAAAAAKAEELILKVL